MYKKRLDESISKKVSKYLDTSDFIKWYKNNKVRIAEILGVDADELSDTESILKISRELINDVINPQSGGNNRGFNKGFAPFVDLEYILIHDFLHNMYQVDAKEFNKSLNRLEYSASEIVEEIECLAIEEKYMKWFNTKVASKERIEQWRNTGAYTSTYTLTEFTHQNLNQLASFLVLTILKDNPEYVKEYFSSGTIKLEIYGKEYDGKGTWLESFYKNAFNGESMAYILEKMTEAVLASNIINEYGGDGTVYPDGNWYGRAYEDFESEYLVHAYTESTGEKVEWRDLPDDGSRPKYHLEKDGKFLFSLDDDRFVDIDDIYREAQMFYTGDYNAFSIYEMMHGYTNRQDTRLLNQLDNNRVFDRTALAILRRSFRSDSMIGNNPNAYKGALGKDAFISISQKPLTDNARKLEAVMKDFVRYAIRDESHLKNKFSELHEPTEDGMYVTKSGYGKTFFNFIKAIASPNLFHISSPSYSINKYRILMGKNSEELASLDEESINQYMKTLYKISGDWDKYKEMLEKSSYYNDKVFNTLPTYQMAKMRADKLVNAIKGFKSIKKDIDNGVSEEEAISKTGIKFIKNRYDGYHFTLE